KTSEFSNENGSPNRPGRCRETKKDRGGRRPPTRGTTTAIRPRGRAAKINVATWGPATQAGPPRRHGASSTRRAT
uniref:Uncharacterized protein n=2 Tax=Ixodes scapularis TaxID=6945 RepID=A0A1S4KJ33_IXOSC